MAYLFLLNKEKEGVYLFPFPSWFLFLAGKIPDLTNREMEDGRGAAWHLVLEKRK